LVSRNVKDSDENVGSSSDITYPILRWKNEILW